MPRLPVGRPEIAEMPEKESSEAVVTNWMQWVPSWILLIALVPSLACQARDGRLGAAESPETAGVETASTTPRNLLLITIDTLRADHLPTYGYPREITPFLSGLAERSVVFEDARSPCSHTAPTHASMFTGFHPLQHRLLENGQPLHESFPTVADVLARGGYRTAAVTTARFLQGVGRGFQDFIKPAQGFGDAAWIVDRGIEWLEGLPPEEPYFLWLHFFDVHEWDDQDRLDGAAIGALPGIAGLHGSNLLQYLTQEQGDPLRHVESSQDLLDMVDAYDAQILAVDRELARLYRFLQAEGSVAPAVWTVTSDHGEGLGNHGHRGHGKYIYNEQLHIPLLFHDPDGGWTPNRIADLVEIVHLGPTLLELGGTSFADRREDRLGRSLIPLLAGTGAWEERFAFAVRRPADEFRLGRGWSPGDVFTLQEKNFKIIVDTAGSTELYDLESDPYEQNPLNESRPRIAARLEGRAGRVFAALQPQDPELEDPKIDAAHIEELKALGYL